MGSRAGGTRGGGQGWLHNIMGKADAGEYGGDGEVDEEVRVAATLWEE